MSHMLAIPEKPLYILKEHLASEPVTLRAKHHGKGGFTFSNTSQGASGEVLFTVDSRAGGVMASKRLIKDATGKGILELWRDVGSDESYISEPSGSSLPFAIVAPRMTLSKEKVDIYAKNAGAEGEETLIEVRGQDIWKRNTLAYWGDDLVMQMRFVNYVTTYVPFSSNQWDVAVAQGFDLFLVSSLPLLMSSIHQSRCLTYYLT